MQKLQNRIVKWNRDRGLLSKFDPKLEIKMLSEEASECMLAEEPAHALQEFCDFLFVVAGTTAKFHAVKHESHMTFISNFENWKLLDRWMEETMLQLESYVAAMIPEQIPMTKAIKAALEIITECNEAKGKKKNKDGKVIKNKDHVDPLDQIRKYLEEYHYGG